MDWSKWWALNLFAFELKKEEEAACTALGLSSASFRVVAAAATAPSVRRIPFRGFLELLEKRTKKPGVGATLPTEKPGEREDGEREEEERRARDGEREREGGIDLGTGSRNEADERRGCSVADGPSSFIANSFRFEAPNDIT